MYMCMHAIYEYSIEPPVRPENPCLVEQVIASLCSELLCGISDCGSSLQTVVPDAGLARVLSCGWLEVRVAMPTGAMAWRGDACRQNTVALAPCCSSRTHVEMRLHLYEDTVSQYRDDASCGQACVHTRSHQTLTTNIVVRWGAYVATTIAESCPRSIDSCF